MSLKRFSKFSNLTLRNLNNMFWTHTSLHNPIMTLQQLLKRFRENWKFACLFSLNYVQIIHDLAQKRHANFRFSRNGLRSCCKVMIGLWSLVWFQNMLFKLLNVKFDHFENLWNDLFFQTLPKIEHQKLKKLMFSSKFLKSLFDHEKSNKIRFLYYSFSFETSYKHISRYEKAFRIWN